VFVLRVRHAATTGFEEIFPAETRKLLDGFATFAVQPDDTGNAVIAIVSGLLDGLHGQTVSVDRGAAYLDNLLTVGPLLVEARS